MRIILSHDHYDADHLADVIGMMRHMGAPAINAVWLPAYSAWMALEGCHRIRAAVALDLAVEIKEVDFDSVFDTDLSDLGWSDFEDSITVEQLADDAHRREIVEVPDI